MSKGNKKLRLYHHISKFKAYRFHRKSARKMLRWALGLKHGDLVSCCTNWPFTSVVDRTEVVKATWSNFWGKWPHARRNHHVDQRGWVIREVWIHTVDGYQHTCDGSGNCVQYPLSVAEITEIVAGRGVSEEEYTKYLNQLVTDGWATKRKVDILFDEYKKARAGIPICDEHGFRLAAKEAKEADEEYRRLKDEDNNCCAV